MAVSHGCSLGSGEASVGGDACDVPLGQCTYLLAEGVRKRSCAGGSVQVWV